MQRAPLFQSQGHSNYRTLARAYSDNDDENSDRFQTNKLGNPFISDSDNGLRYGRLRSVDGTETDPEDDDKRSTLSIDEFGENQNYANRLLRTGRQRKKLAARSKGGEFRQRRKKRRLYFCCLSSEIDVQKLFDHLVGAESLSNGWKYQLHADVLHLYKAGIEDPQPLSLFNTSAASASASQWNVDIDGRPVHGNGMDGIQSSSDNGRIVHLNSMVDRLSSNEGTTDMNHRISEIISNNPNGNRNYMEHQWSDASRISGIGAQEVFVFDFGSAVFWGFSRGEETNLLKTIRMFVTKGFVGSEEFQSGEDDMAFVCVPTVDTETITIANDVITLPDDTATKQRMSVSFAIAQSTVLAIFEARVELKVEDYRYIPETLAASGKVQLTERQLGMMIGIIA